MRIASRLINKVNTARNKAANRPGRAEPRSFARNLLSSMGRANIPFRESTSGGQSNRQTMLDRLRSQRGKTLIG